MSPRDETHRITEAVARAGRVLVGIATRSLARAGDVTFAQFRVLALLAKRSEPLTLGQLACALEIHASSAHRLCSRLEAKGLIARKPSPTDRRIVVISLTRDGERAVQDVVDERRQALEPIVARLTEVERQSLVECLESFSAAAGDDGDPLDGLGWAV